MFSPTAKFAQGHPLMVDYTPAVNVLAGAVILIANKLGISHTPIAAGVQGSLSVGGAVYDVINDGQAQADRSDVYWINQPAQVPSGITQAAGTATATTSTPHLLVAGQSVTITGANQAGYNGTFTVATTPTATTFTFAVPSATVSPATGTIILASTSGGLASPTSNGNTWLGIADGATAAVGGGTPGGSAATRVIVPIPGASSIAGITNSIADPGNAGAIPTTQSGNVQLVTAGAETRTIAAPAAIGVALLLDFKTKVGNCVVTVASTINATGNNTISLTAAGQSIELLGVQGAAGLRWAVRYNDGTTLSTV